MNNVFALAAMIIAYPILFVLPLKINAKQKLLLLMISFMISIAGILSKNLFPIWQALLIMFALAALTSLLISKRMPEIEEYESENQEDYLNEAKLYTNQYLIDEPFIKGESMKSEMAENGEELSDDSNDDFSFLGELEFAISKEDNDENEFDIKDEDTLEELYEELDSNAFVAVAVETEAEEGLNFENLLELEVEVIDVESDSAIITVPESNSYLSEIEKLLQEEELDSLVEEKKQVSPVIEVKNEPSPLKDIKLEKLY